MKTNCIWNGKQNFEASIEGFKISMDAAKPFGNETAPTPKQLLLAALCGCTGMDTIGLLHKYKQIPNQFSIQADAQVAPEHPHIFTTIQLIFNVEGPCEAVSLMGAVNLSQQKYCSLSAMISKGTDITFKVILNKKEIGRGKAEFKK